MGGKLIKLIGDKLEVDAYELKGLLDQAMAGRYAMSLGDKGNLKAGNLTTHSVITILIFRLWEVLIGVVSQYGGSRGCILYPNTGLPSWEYHFLCQFHHRHLPLQCGQSKFCLQSGEYTRPLSLLPRTQVPSPSFHTPFLNSCPTD